MAGGGGLVRLFIRPNPFVAIVLRGRCGPTGGRIHSGKRGNVRVPSHEQRPDLLVIKQRVEITCSNLRFSTVSMAGNGSILGVDYGTDKFGSLDTPALAL